MEWRITVYRMSVTTVTYERKPFGLPLSWLGGFTDNHKCPQ